MIITICIFLLQSSFSFTPARHYCLVSLTLLALGCLIAYFGKYCVLTLCIVVKHPPSPLSLLCAQPHTARAEDFWEGVVTWSCLAYLTR